MHLRSLQQSRSSWSLAQALGHLTFGLSGWGAAWFGVGGALGQDPNTDFFENRIRPVLIERCYECHSEEASDVGGDLKLDSPNGMRRGGTSGAALVPGSVESSLLVRALEYSDAAMQMPPDGKLPQEQIDDFKKWIVDGAVDPRPERDLGDEKPQPNLAELVAKHWAYQPLGAPPEAPTPAGFPSDADGVDRWIVSKLQSQGLSLSPEADRRTLTRRLYYDLIGLPPTADEIEQVVRNESERWYMELVDSLLDSPHFGERMARRWMDVMRYADNKGYVFQEDREYAHAHRYRDWLIRSFNSDLSYDRFLQYQLIGDRLDPENAEGHLDAMGMLTLGRRFLNNKHDIVDDRIDVVTRGLLGVTAQCARCHDHKFDPVTMGDYYSLHALFFGSEEPGGDPSPMRLVDKAEQGPTRIFLRGSPGNPGPEVPRRFLAFLNPKEPVELKTGSGRLELAQAIAEETNPLTARVYVNRLWGWIFGVPLVDSTSDFGVRTPIPVQQEVLDDLAWGFLQDGWSTKRLIRRMVLTSAYRQRSDHRPDAYSVDPENRLWWRAQRKRMDFESYRDALLQASGQLDRTLGGKSVPITEPPFSKRRTLYAYIDRQNLPQLFRSFDFASPDAHVPFRPQTTVPQQGLVLLNSDMVIGLLNDLAAEAAGRPQAEGIDYLFDRILARPCTPHERQWVAELLAAPSSDLPDVPQNQWSYGTATYDAAVGTLNEFTPFPHFQDGKWLGRSGSLPDPDLDWAFLNASGGHPGTRWDQTPVRRWTAFAPGTVRVRGSLKHPSENGNGIRGTIVVRGREKIGEWSVKHGESETHADSIQVQPGDTIDFVADALGEIDSDTFEWKVRIVSHEPEGYRTQSERHFSAQQPRAMTPWEQAAQALLLTNEFCFVD